MPAMLAFMVAWFHPRRVALRRRMTLQMGGKDRIDVVALVVTMRQISLLLATGEAINCTDILRIARLPLGMSQPACFGGMVCQFVEQSHH